MEQLRKRAPLPILKGLVVVNKVEEEELIAEDRMAAIHNTVMRVAAVEGEWSEEVMCSELDSVIGLGFDGVRFARHRALLAVEARTRVSRSWAKINKPYLVENLNMRLWWSIMRICL